MKSNKTPHDVYLHGMQRSPIQVSPVAANKEQWHSFKYQPPLPKRKRTKQQKNFDIDLKQKKLPQYQIIGVFI